MKVVSEEQYIRLFVRAQRLLVAPLDKGFLLLKEMHETGDAEKITEITQIIENVQKALKKIRDDNQPDKEVKAKAKGEKDLKQQLDRYLAELEVRLEDLRARVQKKLN